MEKGQRWRPLVGRGWERQGSRKVPNVKTLQFNPTPTLNIAPPYCLLWLNHSTGLDCSSCCQLKEATGCRYATMIQLQKCHKASSGTI